MTRYIIKKNNIESVKMLNEGKTKSLVLFKKEKILLDNGNIYYTNNEASIAKKEKQIVKIFKNKNTSKNGYGVCSYCNKRIHKDNCTVDHIQPLSSFGGKRVLREDKELWEMAWDKEYNLALACEDCNSEKDNLNVRVFEHKLSILDRKAKILNMNKLKNSATECSSKGINRKVGFRIPTANNKHNYFSAMYMAKADSNILDKNLILY